MKWGLWTEKCNSCLSGVHLCISGVNIGVYAWYIKCSRYIHTYTDFSL